MSNKMLNLVRDAKIGDPVAKEVLKLIADQSNDAGSGVWSSFQYIAWCLERDRSTIIRKCKKLEERGILTSTKRSGSTNLWYISTEKLAELARTYRYKIEVKGEGLQTATPSSGTVPPEEGQTATPVVATDDPSPSVTSTETEEELPSTEPIRVVIDPYGEELPKKKICQMCEARPKGKNRRLYCDDCGEIVEAWFNTRAVKTYEKREPNYHLSENQVKMINETVGDVDADLYRWGAYLDYWLTSGWHVGKAGLGNLIEAYKSRSLDDKVSSPTTNSAPRLTQEQLEKMKEQ